MSNADTPRTTESHQATRQILDELDALMDRMMALPVDDGEIASENLPAPQPAKPAAAAATIEPPAPEKPEAGVPIDYEDADSEPKPTLSYTFPEEQSDSPPTDRPVYLTDDVIPIRRNGVQAPESIDDVLPPITPIPKFEVPSIKNEPPKRYGWSPLLRINEAFDGCTRWMGRVGVWIRSKHGRALIGIMGAALLIWAIVWGVSIWCL